MREARFLEGQQRGESGEEHVLAWESFPYTALDGLLGRLADTRVERVGFSERRRFALDVVQPRTSADRAAR